jgi:hypothetical protein
VAASPIVCCLEFFITGTSYFGPVQQGLEYPFSVKKKMMVTRRNVPTASTRPAMGFETIALVAGDEELGKYSPTKLVAKPKLPPYYYLGK